MPLAVASGELGRQERVIELRNRVRAVDTADAEQVLVCVEEWSQTLDDLEVFGPT